MGQVYIKSIRQAAENAKSEISKKEEVHFLVSSVQFSENLLSCVVSGTSCLWLFLFTVIFLCLFLFTGTFHAFSSAADGMIVDGGVQTCRVLLCVTCAQ